MLSTLKFPLFAFALVVVASLTSPTTGRADDLPTDGGKCPRTTCAFGHCEYDGNHGYCSGAASFACSWQPCN